MSPELAHGILLAGSFLMGSLPFGLWVARAFHKGDLRVSGSGNIGATNVSRVAGFWPAGVITFALDLAKGAIPAAVAAHADPSFLGFTPEPSDAWVAGFCAVLGHCFSPWLRFKGGKGVSTSLGALLVLSPFSALVGIGIFAAFFAYSGTASIASLSGIGAAAATHLILYPAGKYVWALVAIVLTVLIRHESNLDALLEGKERTFGRSARALLAAFLLTGALASAPAYAREVVDATGTRVVVPDSPARVVTLAPSLGELAADILGDRLERIVGVSEYTDFPPSLARKKSIGPYARFNLELVLSLKPDLVLATLDGNPKDQINHLRELKVPVVVVAGGDFSQVGQSMRLVAQALGAAAEGERMAAQFSNGLSRIQERARKSGPKPRVLVQVGDNPLVVVGGKSFIQSALQTVGGENVYADASAHYPRPSIEDAVARNPDSILVLALGKEESAHRAMAGSWKRFPRIKAVSAGRVKVVPGDTVARPTLRLLEGLSLLEKAIHEP